MATSSRTVMMVGAVVLSLAVVHAWGQASRRSTYQQFGDFRSLLCVSWKPASTLTRTDRDLWLQHAPEHAWAYGYVAGAGYFPSTFDRSTERLMQIDIRGIDARLDHYCAAHPDATLAQAMASLVKELAAMR